MGWSGVGMGGCGGVRGVFERKREIEIEGEIGMHGKQTHTESETM